MTCERGNLSRPLLAFIVDQYLSRNQFSQTRASFRKEASSVFANARPNQNLLSLEEMMYQYIRMKKQNIELVKEKVMLIQEKNRIQTLLQDMQNALDIFSARSPLSNVAAMITNSSLVPPIQNSNTTPPVASNTMSLPPKPMNNVNFSSPMISVSGKKRKDSPTVDGSPAAKKRRGRPPVKKKPVQDFGSSSAMTQSLVGNFAGRASHISHDVSPSSTDISPVATCNGEVIAPSYNVISTKRVIVQPQEEMVYKEGNHDISLLEASKRDTTDNTSMRALDVNSSHILENLDKSSSNEIPISDKERDNCAHLDFSGLDYWLKIYFSSFEIEDSFSNMSRDAESRFF